MSNFRTALATTVFALSFSLSFSPGVRADLENHYTFDDPNDVTADSSGQGRHGALDDFEVTWVNDDERGGVLEFGGGTHGFVIAEIPDLSEAFTIMMWAYRDPELCCETVSGANDGLFQVQIGIDDIENIPAPLTGGTDKVIGGWVLKAGGAVWGRINTLDGTINLNNATYFMDDGVWTHLAYRGTGSELEVVVNGESQVGPWVTYDGEAILDHDTIYIGRQGVETWGGRLDDFRVYSHALSDEEILAIVDGDGGNGGGDLLGDFDLNGVLEAADIDALTNVVISGSNDPAYDLDNDNLVNDADRRVWVEDLKNTYFGDGNLDGEFNSSDLVMVLAAGTYEVDLDSTWASGDFNGDRRTNSSDLVTALAGGGYEQGPRAAVSAVPEPSGVALLGLAGLVFLRRRLAVA